MSHDIIQGWLGLPTADWPPDHYTLLDLKPGEPDIARIERHAQERLSKVRAYQISHPESATEAMNRLAQAFMCLTDPNLKETYDREHGINGTAALTKANGQSSVRRQPSKAVVALPPKSMRRIPDDTVTNMKTKVEWEQAPPPVRATPQTLGEETVELGEDTQIVTQPDTVRETPAEQPPVAEKADQPYDLERSSEARRGLGTYEALIDRIDHTRQIAWVWKKLGTFIRDKKRMIAQEEAADFARYLRKLEQLIEDFPRILGHPGQAGYRILAMARLGITADMFNSLDGHERKALARDWLAACIVLGSYRRFLAQELNIISRQGWLGKSIRALRAAVNEHPVWSLSIILLTGALAGFIIYTI